VGIPGSVANILDQHLSTIIIAADAKALVRKAREFASEFEFDNGYAIPAHYLAKKIADENQLYTQHAYKRTYGVIMLLGRYGKVPIIPHSRETAVTICQLQCR
jgi:hypothetical protein